MPMIEIGRLGRPHGLKGEQALVPCALTALELHAVKSFTWQGPDGVTRPITLATARPTHDRMLVRFAEAHNREGASELTNGRVMVEPERLPDPGPGLAYTFRLIGLEVVTEEGRAVGTVAEIWPTPANAVLVVRGEGEVLIPSVPEFVKAIDLGARRITVRLLPGMEEAGRSP
ncbi:MAG TPA: ribosome maturation factor RimM [Candidatus Eisenbacteria bacterium]|nr:ribosome maturation factor RimM [Candidatus Eisenbacteria bacterium]